MGTADCVWSDLFDDGERKSLDEGLLFIAFVSVLLESWLSMSILLSKLSLDSSYRNLANFTVAASVRKIVYFISQLSLFELFSSSNEVYSVSCKFFAFLETFLAVFEVEWLTHVCIERYVVAKYTTNGWLVKKNHYTLFQCLCLFFASLYSFPPLIGIGRYGFNFSCSFCTFDMMLPDSWTRYIVVMIFLLRSVKPAMFMFIMLTWARILEKKLVCSEETHKQVKFTKNVIIVSLVNQLCWSPIALIRGGVVFSQFFNINSFMPASGLYIKWAMWIHWMAPAVTAMTLFVVDNNIKENMLRLPKKELDTKKED